VTLSGEISSVLHPNPRLQCKIYYALVHFFSYEEALPMDAGGCAATATEGPLPTCYLYGSSHANAAAWWVGTYAGGSVAPSHPQPMLAPERRPAHKQLKKDLIQHIGKLSKQEVVKYVLSLLTVNDSPLLNSLFPAIPRKEKVCYNGLPRKQCLTGSA
jgi:hypothetical protein